MKTKNILKIILILSGIGILFSGFLTYTELLKSCIEKGACGLLAGIPSCLYGFFLYLLIFVLSIIVLRREK